VTSDDNELPEVFDEKLEASEDEEVGWLTFDVIRN